MIPIDLKQKAQHNFAHGITIYRTLDDEFIAHDWQWRNSVIGSLNECMVLVQNEASGLLMPGLEWREIAKRQGITPSEAQQRHDRFMRSKRKPATPTDAELDEIFKGF